MENWGMEGLSNNDMVIPRIQLMQALSQSVKDEKAKAGDILSSQGELLAARGKFVPIIPVMTFREWIINDVSEGKGKEKFLSRFPVTGENERLPVEGDINGVPITRTKNLNYFVLLPNHLDELPYLISFRKMSYQAGKSLSTMIQIQGFKRKPFASMVYLLGSRSETRGKNSYYVFTVNSDRETTEQELEAAKKWNETLNQNRSNAAQLAAPQVPMIGGGETEEVVPF